MDDMSDMLSSFGLKQEQKKPWCQAADPIERQKSRDNAGYNRAHALRILAKDRKHWFVELGIETLYFPDGSIFLRIPANETEAAVKNGVDFHHVIKRIIEGFSFREEVAKDEPFWEFKLIETMFVKIMWRETGLNPDLSRIAEYPCEDKLYLQVYDYTDEEKERLVELLEKKDES